VGETWDVAHIFSQLAQTHCTNNRNRLQVFQPRFVCKLLNARLPKAVEFAEITAFIPVQPTTDDHQALRGYTKETLPHGRVVPQFEIW
jgi:hypothetical protein